MPQQYAKRAQYETFAKLLTSYLNKEGRSNGDLARAVQVDSSTVSRWCQGTQKPDNKEKVYAICRYLRIPDHVCDEMLIDLDYPPRRPYSIGSAKPAKTVSYDDFQNCEEEIAAFRNILTGEDDKTRLVLVYGPSGSGKSHLLAKFQDVAEEHKVRTLPIDLEAQITVEDCLHSICAYMGLPYFVEYQEYLAEGKPHPLTYNNEKDWLRVLTMKFFNDVARIPDLQPLVLFFDPLNKADPTTFKYWLNRSFLPQIFQTRKIMVVIADQEEPESNTAWRHHLRFHLNGLPVECFYRFAEIYEADWDESFIERLHTVLNGVPKSAFDYIRVQAGRTGHAKGGLT